MKQFLALIFLITCCMLNAQQEVLEIVPIKEADRNALIDPDPIYTIVQEAPQFPGGNEAMMEFVSEHLQYPKEAKDQNIQGTVYAQLLINKEGCIDTSAINILRGVHPSLDKESIRVIKAMPCWTPGYQRGNPVRVYVNLPFRFMLNDGE
ncbi:MAG: energy transducer TonB [Flavobacteriales bacterium]